MLKFKNRQDAAAQLVQKLLRFKHADGMVLSVPRGGVPIGYVIAKELKFPLEIILSKKISHPFNREFAIGSVTLHGSVIDSSISGIHPDYIRHEEDTISRLLKEQFTAYMDKRSPSSLKNKTVILTDDGVATGNTLYAATEAIKAHKPKEIIIAVPVSSTSAALKLSQLSTEFISLITTEKFKAVAEFYTDFSPTEDEEVIYLLQLANNI